MHTKLQTQCTQNFTENTRPTRDKETTVIYIHDKSYRKLSKDYRKRIAKITRRSYHQAPTLKICKRKWLFLKSVPDDGFYKPKHVAQNLTNIAVKL
jgi:hypothetical protein